MMTEYFLDTSFIMALLLDSDSNHKKAVNLAYVLNEKCYINNNILNEVLTLTGRKLNISAAREVYYNMKYPIIPQKTLEFLKHILELIQKKLN